jgi:HK97 family phage portal protein
MALMGEAFWYILRDPEYQLPMAVEVLHPAFMEVKQKDGKTIYEYGTGQNKTILETENVIHIPLKSLPSANRALSPTDYAGVAGALAMAAYEFGSSWFSQGQAPSFILGTDQKLGQAEVDRIADKFMIRHAGPANAHRPVVLDSGLKATKVMASPDEAQYLNTLEYSRQCLGAWFGIPPSKMPNALQRQPSAPPHVRQEEQEGFIADTLTGYLAPLEEVHSALLEATSEFACFETDKLTRADAQFLAQQVQAYRITQAASINDVRTRLIGWAPVEGGDQVMAPLASNTSPSQTGNQGAFPDAGPNKNAGSEREALVWIANRLRQLDDTEHLMVS